MPFIHSLFPSAAGGAAYTGDATNYPGPNTYYQSSTNFTGHPGAQKPVSFTFSINAGANLGARGNQQLFYFGGFVSSLQRNFGSIEGTTDSGNPGKFGMTFTGGIDGASPELTGNWHDGAVSVTGFECGRWWHFFISRNSSGNSVCYVIDDAGTITDKTSNFSQDTKDWMTGAYAITHWVGSGQGGGKAVSGWCLANLGYSANDLDFGTEANLRKFVSDSGVLQAADTDGWSQWGGVQPRFWTLTGNPNDNIGTSSAVGWTATGSTAVCADPPNA